MKLDVTQVLKSFNGKAIKHNNGTDKDPDIVDLTMRICLTNALMYTTQQEHEAGPDANGRLKRFMLAMEIEKHDEVELTLDELTDVKKRINEFYQTIVVGRATLVLDPSQKQKIHNARIDAKKAEEAEKKKKE